MTKIISEEEKKEEKKNQWLLKIKNLVRIFSIRKELRKIEEEEIAQRKLELKKRMAKLLK